MASAFVFDQWTAECSHAVNEQTAKVMCHVKYCKSGTACAACYDEQAVHCVGYVKTGERSHVCDRLVCDEHRVEIAGQIYCRDCASNVSAAMDFLATRLERIAADLRARTVPLDDIDQLLGEYSQQALTAANRQQ